MELRTSRLLLGAIDVVVPCVTLGAMVAQALRFANGSVGTGSQAIPLEDLLPATPLLVATAAGGLLLLGGRGYWVAAIAAVVWLMIALVDLLANGRWVLLPLGLVTTGLAASLALKRRG